MRAYNRAHDTGTNRIIRSSDPAASAALAACGADAFRRACARRRHDARDVAEDWKARLAHAVRCLRSAPGEVRHSTQEGIQHRRCCSNAHRNSSPERGRRHARSRLNNGNQVGDRPHHAHRQDKATHRPPPDLRQLRASRPRLLPRLILSLSKDGGGKPQRTPNQRQRTSTHTNPAAPRQGSRPRAYPAATAHFRSTIGSPTSFAGGWFIGRDGAAPGR
jgi:hypothetical protein